MPKSSKPFLKISTLTLLLLAALLIQTSCTAKKSHPTQPANNTQPTNTPQTGSTPGSTPTTSPTKVPSATVTAVKSSVATATPTHTPFCTHNSSAGDSNNNVTSAGCNLIACEFSLAQTSAISDIRWTYQSNNYGHNVILGFYNNANNSNLGTTGPDSLITQVGTFAMANDAAQTFSFSPVTFTSGTYWIAAMGASDSSFGISADTVTVGTAVSYKLTVGFPSSTTLPSTFPQMNQTNLIPNMLVDFCY